MPEGFYRVPEKGCSRVHVRIIIVVAVACVAWLVYSVIDERHRETLRTEFCADPNVLCVKQAFYGMSVGGYELLLRLVQAKRLRSDDAVVIQYWPVIELQPIGLNETRAPVQPYRSRRILLARGYGRFGIHAVDDYNESLVSDRLDELRQCGVHVFRNETTRKSAWDAAMSCYIIETESGKVILSRSIGTIWTGYFDETRAPYWHYLLMEEDFTGTRVLVAEDWQGNTVVSAYPD